MALQVKPFEIGQKIIDPVKIPRLSPSIFDPNVFRSAVRCPITNRASVKMALKVALVKVENSSAIAVMTMNSRKSAPEI